MPIPATFSRQGRIGLLCIDNPPVNALSPQTVAATAEAIAMFEAADDVDALVAYCAGRTFIAGGDIAAFEDPAFSAAPYNALLARIEAGRRPVVSALHGTALGGGLELALACHHRFAQPLTRRGLPEVKIGLLPGSLGAQRLPRLVGAPLALELISSGRMLGARQALDAGLVDDLKDGEPREIGVAAARLLVAAAYVPRRTSLLPVPPVPEALLAKAEADAAGWCIRRRRRRCATCSSPNARPRRYPPCRATRRCGRCAASASSALARWAAASR